MENEEFPKNFTDIKETLKYIADAQARFEWHLAEDRLNIKRMQEENEKRHKENEQIIRHLSNLAGITFEQLNEINNRLQAAAESLQK